MKFFNKYFYGDYDAIKGGDSTNAASSAKSNFQSSDVADTQSHPGGDSGGQWPLWEIFIRSKQGLDHKHVGSLHAADAQMAIENARDVYTRRQEGVSIWVVESKFIHASNPDDAESFYEPANDKVYRHPTFYGLPDELTHM
jgi:ring-1,2-phenylacetyl-CoA epoxidase subunit PaaB